MKYRNIEKAKFLSRPNRFIAQVEIDNRVEIVHVKNTGRCRELLLPGCDVILEKSENPNRKTSYDLVCVYKDGLGWVNIDSQVPNKVVREWIESLPPLFRDVSLIKPEYKYGKSRMDFYLERNKGDKKVLIEVKGCTLEVDGIGYFPDAPTIRGIKHLMELSEASEVGYECYLIFVIAMPEVKKVLPNMGTHPEFGYALDKAVKAGVKVVYLECNVTEDSISAEGYSEYPI